MNVILINGISNNLQKLRRYFNGTTIFVFFKKLFPPSASDVFPARAALYVNYWELSILKLSLLTGTLRLLNCHKLPDISEWLSLYSIKLYIGNAM